MYPGFFDILEHFDESLHVQWLAAPASDADFRTFRNWRSLRFSISITMLIAPWWCRLSVVTPLFILCSAKFASSETCFIPIRLGWCGCRWAEILFSPSAFPIETSMWIQRTVTGASAPYVVALQPVVDDILLSLAWSATGIWPFVTLIHPYIYHIQWVPQYSSSSARSSLSAELSQQWLLLPDYAKESLLSPWPYHIWFWRLQWAGPLQPMTAQKHYSRM